MKKIVLHVEDDHEIRRIVKETIIENGKYDIKQYNHAVSAIRDIKNGEKYDFAIIDWSLYGKSDGEDVMRVSKEINPNVPVISFSGWSDICKYADYAFSKDGCVSGLLLVLKEAESFNDP